MPSDADERQHGDADHERPLKKTDRSVGKYGDKIPTQSQGYDLRDVEDHKRTLMGNGRGWTQIVHERH